MKNSELEKLINDKLNSSSFSDYAPNGLQVEGREQVQKIVTGVTASQALIDEAVRQKADAVIVHHGYFWKGESPVIRGMKRNRLKNAAGKRHQPLRLASAAGRSPATGEQRPAGGAARHYRHGRNRAAGALGRAIHAGTGPGTGLLD